MSPKRLKKLKARVENTLKEMPLAPKQTKKAYVPTNITDTPEYNEWLHEKREYDTNKVIGHFTQHDSHRSSAPGHNHF